MNLDVRLDQDPQAVADGQGLRAGRRCSSRRREAMRGWHVAPPPGEAINIEVASSQIDLGVVQGFTSYVTKVTGTLQANFKITGSGYDPHLDGAIDIKGGAFTAPDLGTSFYGARHAHRPEAGRRSRSASSGSSTRTRSR